MNVVKLEQILAGLATEFLYEKTVGYSSESAGLGRDARGECWVHTIPVCEREKKVHSANWKYMSCAKFLKGHLLTSEREAVSATPKFSLEEVILDEAHIPL